MKKKVLWISILIGLVIILGNINSEILTENSSYELAKFTYAPGENLDGWINLNISEEPGETLIEDSLGNKISLLEFLEKNGESFSCSIENCNPDYLIKKKETIKNIFLEKGESALIGIVLENSPVGEIKFINFTLESNASIGCENQIEIDFLNDGEIELVNNNPGTGICIKTKNYGCFDLNSSFAEARIPNDGREYCQKVDLIKSPKFILGADVKQESGISQITMTLYSEFWEEISECNLTDISGVFEEKSCAIDYSTIQDREGFICISSTGDGVAKIKAAAKENCGKERFPEYINDLSFSYKMFAVGSTFAPFPKIEIKNSVADGSLLSSLVPPYLDSIYPDYPHCPAEGCIIPIKINSKIDQTINLKDLSMEYDVQGIDTLKVNQFVELEEVAPLVNTNGFKKLDLKNANFSISGDYGNLEYWIKINNQTILIENLTIDRVPEIKKIYPLSTYSSYPTEFKLQILSNASISSVFWDFGDGTNATSLKVSKIHTYSGVGNYSLYVKVTDDIGRVSYKTFLIEVGSPEQIINSTIQKYFENSKKIRSFAEGLSDFEKSEILKILNLEENEEKVKSLQRDYLIATSLSEYNEIMTNLLDIFIPEEVYVSLFTQPLDYAIDSENIDLEALKQAGGGDYASAGEEDYKNSILYWNQKNLATKVSIKSYNLRSLSGDVSHLISFIKITPSKTSSSTETAYLLIRNLEDINFKENYYETNVSGYISIDLDSISSDSIEFSTSEEVKIETLPIIISPGLNYLELGKTPEEAEDKPLGWTMIFLIIILALIIGAGIYIVLHHWYKSKYETYLFKNRNNLYNLLVYFENSIKKGVSEEQIKKDLKKAGWTSEQINYASKKYANKSIGLNWVTNLFTRKNPSLTANKNASPIIPKTSLDKRFPPMNKRFFRK